MNQLLVFLSSFSCWQLIQSLATSTIVWCQFDIQTINSKGINVIWLQTKELGKEQLWEVTSETFNDLGTKYESVDHCSKLCDASSQCSSLPFLRFPTWKIELETPIYHTSYYYTRHVYTLHQLECNREMNFKFDHSL